MSMKQLTFLLEVGILGLMTVILFFSSMERTIPLEEQGKAIVADNTEQVITPAEVKKKVEKKVPKKAIIDAKTARAWKRDQWVGDLADMKKRKAIRVLVPFSRTFFFLDRGKKRGLIHDSLMIYEKFLNKKIKDRTKHIHIVIIPTPRDQLFSDLMAGYGDIAAGNLTITRERQKLIDFCDPALTGVTEIIVTHKDGFVPENLFDLSGKEIMVRKSSSYYESLTELNNTLISIGKAPVIITDAAEDLEDEDLLDMVNANLVPMIIIDSHKGEFWAKILPDIRLQPNVRLRTDGEIGWAVRKNTPDLKKNINRFVKANKKGSLTGNILFQRYLQETSYIQNSMSAKAREQYNQTIELFKKYGTKYNFPYLLLTALAFQESGLDQGKRSQAGAVGIMQILPTTAADKNVQVKDIHKMENNIQAGTRYLRFMADRYFSEPDLTPLNQDLFTMAAFNAGPAKVVSLRKEAARRGFNPDIWFNNVEMLAAARIGRETVQYVRNIYKYYVAYEYMIEREEKLNMRQGKKVAEDSVIPVSMDTIPILKPRFFKKRP